MIRTLVVMAALCAVVACKKPDNKSDTSHHAPRGSATAGGSAEGSAAATPDPWAAGPATKVATGTGVSLSKIDLATDPAPRDGLSAKVKLEDIARPSDTKLALKGLTSEKLTGFEVTYNASKNPVHEQFRTALQSNHVFEQVAEGLNKTLRIPQTVDIELVDCNTVNAFYDPSTKRIIVCYELLDYFLEVFKPTATSTDQLGNAVIGATMFSFYHETGHGLINLLDLPAVGREEDSVDQLATLTLIAMGDEGVAMAESGAYWFQLQSKQGSHQTPFWDEHGFDGQRFYNIMCLITDPTPTSTRSSSRRTRCRPSARSAVPRSTRRSTRRGRSCSSPTSRTARP